MSFPLFASADKVPCRYDLIGPLMPPHAFFERDLMTSQECRKLAQEKLEAHTEYYKAIIKDLESGKMSEIYPNEKSK